MVRLLKEHRERVGLSQDELADLTCQALGLHQAQICNIERGERRVDLVELREFCLALGVPLAVFIAEWELRLAEPSAQRPAPLVGVRQQVDDGAA